MTEPVPPPGTRALSVAEAAALWRRAPRGGAAAGFSRSDRIVALLFAGQLAAAAVFGGVLVHGLHDKNAGTATLVQQAGQVPVSGGGGGAGVVTPTGAATAGPVGPSAVAGPGAVGEGSSAPVISGPSALATAGPHATASAPGGSTAPSAANGGMIAPGAPIKVGSIVSQNGVISFRTSALGTKAYFDMVNAKGGVAGHQISLELLDDQLDKNTGHQEFEKLVSDNVFTMAAFNAPQTEAGLKPDIEANKIPLVGSYGEYDEYHSQYAYAFSANYIHYGYEMGAYLKSLGATKAALIYVDNNDANANGQIEQGFVAGFGKTWDYLARVGPTHTFQSDATQMQLKGIDGMVTILDTGSYERLLQAMGSNYKNIKHVADAEFAVPAITQGDYAAQAEGTYIASDFDFIDDAANPNVAAYVNAVRSEFGSDAPVDYLGLVGWTDAKILVDALNAMHGVFTRTGLLTAIDHLGAAYQTGVSAPLQFGPGNRDVNKCLLFGKLTGGKVVQTQGYTCDNVLHA
ncbi:MAG TPA: ABC transporter substrate-binding protein [Mycobacteriales bacterium]|nr:ABC transporter substrate-binding protein [Mycobacteriales bacterium]